MPPASANDQVLQVASSVRLSRRRRLQFSLRSLLVTTVLTGALFGWLRHRIIGAQHQEKIVQQLEDLGASIHYKHQWCEISGRYGHEPPRVSAFWRALFGEHFFMAPDAIWLDRFRGNQNDFALVGELPTLTKLNADGPTIDDEYISFLRPLVGLKKLVLWNIPITDQSLEQFDALRKLEVLSLYKTRVTERGAKKF
jgi:hypothetical protein